MKTAIKTQEITNILVFLNTCTNYTVVLLDSESELFPLQYLRSRDREHLLFNFDQFLYFYFLQIHKNRNKLHLGEIWLDVQMKE